jgi:endonuclease-3
MLPRDPETWRRILDTLEREVGKNKLPSVSELAEGGRDPFRILISTILSLRTKDEVTLAASLRLFARADTPQTLVAVPVDEIRRLIYPVGFYLTKGERIADICRILLDRYNGRVPDTQEDLLALPGVGLKTANLVLGLGYGKPYLCVDTHVHRIANRLGWIKTKTAEETEKKLSPHIPPESMVRINELMVLFGQTICRPQSPWCSRCPLAEDCPRVGVERSR